MDFATFQQTIEETYGARDRARGQVATVAWLCEEVGELAKAARKGSREEQLHELATSWPGLPRWRTSWISRLARRLSATARAALAVAQNPADVAEFALASRGVGRCPIIRAGIARLYPVLVATASHHCIDCLLDAQSIERLHQPPVCSAVAGQEHVGLAIENHQYRNMLETSPRLLVAEVHRHRNRAHARDLRVEHCKVGGLCLDARPNGTPVVQVYGGDRSGKGSTNLVVHPLGITCDQNVWHSTTVVRRTSLGRHYAEQDQS